MTKENSTVVSIDFLPTQKQNAYMYHTVLFKN